MFGGLFNRRKEAKIIEYVWKNNTAKYKGISNFIQSNPSVLFLYYFSETKSQFEQLAEIMQLDVSADFHHIKKITITNAENILNSTIDLTNTTICFIEHHPSYIAEQKVLQYLAEELNIKSVYFQTSLQKPLLLLFGGEKIAVMMDRMGCKEDESLQHSMISNSIQNAQKKIDEQGPVFIERQTARSWFEANIGG